MIEIFQDEFFDLYYLGDFWYMDDDDETCARQQLFAQMMGWA